MLFQFLESGKIDAEHLGRCTLFDQLRPDRRFQAALLCQVPKVGQELSLLSDGDDAFIHERPYQPRNDGHCLGSDDLFHVIHSFHLRAPLNLCGSEEHIAALLPRRRFPENLPRGRLLHDATSRVAASQGLVWQDSL